MHKRTILLLPIILIFSLACTIFVGGPDYPEPPIPVSTEAATSLKDEIKAAVTAGALTGQVTLIMSEVQLTSYLASRIANDPTPMFTDPQVFLRDGQMRIFGKTQQGYFAANIRLVLTVGPDSKGNPELQLSAADFGPFPSPEGLNKAITAIIEEAYTGALGPVATGFRITAITIKDGLMMIIGNIR
jgi:hypothetical protein